MVMGGILLKNWQVSLQDPKRVFRYLLITLVALIVADGLITRFLITNNLATEANPFLRTLAGSDDLLAVKLVGSILCAYLLWIIYKRKPRLSLTVTTVCVFCYTVILYWNLCVFFIASY